MKITKKDAQLFAKYIGLDLRKTRFKLKDLVRGMNVELEHGTINPYTNVTNNSILLTGKIALAHLLEAPNYYRELKKMEKRLLKY